MLGQDPEALRQLTLVVNRDRCLGVLAFPFMRDLLIRSGVDGKKIHDCWPVVDFERFDDLTPNRDAVMNLGVCLPKKAMDG